MKRIALRILALMLVWTIIPSTRAQESKTLDDFKREAVAEGFWRNFSREGRLSLFSTLIMRQALLPIPAGSCPSGR